MVSSLCVAAAFLAQPSPSAFVDIELDADRLNATFPQSRQIESYLEFLELSHEQTLIVEEAVEETMRANNWCEDFFLSAAAWNWRWTEELGGLAANPAGHAQVGSLALDENVFWDARERLEQELFETLNALLPEQSEFIALLQRSRERGRIFRMGFPGTSCPDVLDFVTAHASLKVSHPDARLLLATYDQQVTLLADARSVHFEKLLEVLETWRRGARALDGDEVAKVYSDIAKNSADIRSLVRSTARGLHHRGFIDDNELQRLLDSMYPLTLDRNHSAVAQLNETVGTIRDEATRANLRAIADGIAQASRDRWSDLRDLYDSAYERRSIEAWAERMAEHLLNGAPFPTFHDGFEELRAEIFPLPEPLALQVARLERDELAALSYTDPVILHGDADDGFRLLIREADETIGLRFAWFLPDFVEARTSIAEPGVVALLAQYRNELTVLASGFRRAATEYERLGEPSGTTAARGSRQALGNLYRSVKSIDALHERMLEELAAIGCDRIKEDALEAGYAGVFARSPVAELLEALGEVEQRLTDEERRDIGLIRSAYLEKAEDVQRRLLAALSQWEAVESALSRMADAERNGRLGEWRKWGEAQHPSIPIWKEQTELVRTTWTELVAVFSQERVAELPATLQLALALGARIGE